MTTSPQKSATLGPWSVAALVELEEWDADFAAACHAMSTNPWTSGVLPTRLVELIAVAIGVSCTNLDRASTRQHMCAALDAGATRQELLTVVKMAAVMALHSASLGAPILIEEAAAAGTGIPARPDVATPAIDHMKAIGQWNTAWDPFLTLDPQWTDQFMATGAGIYGSGVFSAKETELLSVAFDASFTHMYAPGTRRHIRGALAAGASVAEIMDVLKICVASGVSALNVGVPMLAEVLGRAERGS